MSETADNKTLTKTISSLLLFAASAMATATITHYVNSYYKNKDNDKQKEVIEVNKVLDKYSQGLNTHCFRAYDLFANTVDEFITMKNTSPAEIDAYISHYYYHQFLKPTVTFDKQSTTINYVDENGIQADVVENDEYIKAKSTKIEQHQSRVRIYLTKDYKIKVFTLYKIIF